MMKTIGGVILGAAIMLTGILIGISISNENQKKDKGESTNENS